jgi:dimethylhistidine N-methyltransferase
VLLVADALDCMSAEPQGDRHAVESNDADADRAEFAREVARGLGQNPKSLPCRYFYDARGSALFERICELPEYYLTRTEHGILESRAADIAAGLPQPITLVELGSGSSIKTRTVIETLLSRQGKLRYVPIDISASALSESTQALTSDYPELRITGLALEYRAGLRRLRTSITGPKLELWLGSNVGNFERGEAAAFLAEVGTLLGPDDRLLCGIDLRKDPGVLEAAYDDPQGVTAEFNLNLLARINRELGGNFDLTAFRHRSGYEPDPGRMAMFLVSQRAQVVRIATLGQAFRFAAGEAIHTESSFKYSVREIAELAQGARLRIEHQWYDAQQWFCVTLLARA